jgi:LmbE family N-acetylglucosaminyl deacetylase
VRLLAIGAHPDDVEIGAATLLTSALDQGFEVRLLILTDEEGMRNPRRNEALRSARRLGLPPALVTFAGLPDGRLRADRRSVRRVRDLVTTAPDLVVTHTQADSHNDHVEASRIAHAAFRECFFLHFSIYLSSERERFAPRVFVGVPDEALNRKLRALAAYGSQRERLGRMDLAGYEAAMGKLAGLTRAEAFEVSSQNGAAEVLAERILALSESPFHRFWTPVVANAEITLFYEGFASPGAPIDWPTSHADAGRDALRQAFRDQWLPRSPLRETFCSSASVQQVLETQSVILAGGAVSNLLVRDLYNRFRGTVWTIDYEMPRLEPAYLHNRTTGVRLYPRLAGPGEVTSDFGVIARVASPYARGSSVVCAAGATGLGTRVALEFLASPAAQPDVAKYFEGRGNVQLAFSVGRDRPGLEILDVCYE